MRYILVLMALGILALPVFADNSSLNVTDNSSLNVTTLNITNATAMLGDCNGNDTASVGALPGDFTYGFKRFFEGVQEFFTFDPNQNAIVHAEHGKLRAEEAHLMTCRALEEQQSGNESQVNETLSSLQQLVSDENTQFQTANADLDNAANTGATNSTVVSQVDNDTRNSIDVLQNVYALAPESAKAGLLNALNNSINNYEKHEQKMQEMWQRGHGDDGSNQTSDNDTDNMTWNESENGFGNGNYGNSQGNNGNGGVGNNPGFGHGDDGSNMTSQNNESENGFNSQGNNESDGFGNTHGFGHGQYGGEGTNYSMGYNGTPGADDGESGKGRGG